MRGAAPAAIASSAPGRICLFGEHQDYLGLPVIAMAIDLRIELRGRRRDDGDATLRIELPDLGRRDAFNPNEEPVYRHGRDYLPAAANVLRRLGLSWPTGYDIRVTSRIPINAGASSSSALQVAWVGFLLAAAGDARATDPLFVAEIAFQSEVAEFGSPGGMMDQFSTALGGMIYLETRPPYRVERLPARDWAFVLIDSGEPKGTNEVLGRVRGGVEAGLAALRAARGGAAVDVGTLTASEAAELEAGAARELLESNLRSREITQEARRRLEQPACEPREIGALLERHHAELAEHLRVSTERIDGLLRRAREMGAFGGKINGSGGGGGCFSLCPVEAERVAAAIRADGYRVDVVRPAEGLRVKVGEMA
ncbi:MAG: Galactokinase [candidate division BRC1 bacterium ADurb.BinA292]|nr:MAG: Galactokinase [candidate division BRC1 bacterium ADurb.BinA292]